MWQDRVVLCSNTITGEFANFLLGTQAPQKTASYTYEGLPYANQRVLNYRNLNDLSKIVWIDSEEGPVTSRYSWRFNTIPHFQNKGWDLQPLLMYENKPYSEAILAKKEGKYHWFVCEGSLTKKELEQRVPLTEHFWTNLRDRGARNDGTDYWNLTSLTHSPKSQWEAEGYRFLKEQEKVTVPNNPTALQQQLIQYCSAKTSRVNHLVELTKLGALNNAATYDEIATTIHEYLDSNSSICDEGREKALKALGLEVKIWVHRQIAVSDIILQVMNGKRIVIKEDKPPRSDNPRYMIKVGSDLWKVLNTHFPGNYKMYVWVEE